MIYRYSRGFGLIAPYLGSDSFFNKPNGLYGLLFYTAESLLGNYHTFTKPILLYIVCNISTKFVVLKNVFEHMRGMYWYFSINTRFFFASIFTWHSWSSQNYQVYANYMKPHKFTHYSINWTVCGGLIS